MFVSNSNDSRNRILAIFVFLTFLGFLLNMPGVSAVASAQEKYPDRPINIIVGLPAGGSTDLQGRALVSAAGKILGQPGVVLNKPGGAYAVALMALKSEKPDGYTVGILGIGAILSQYINKVNFDTIKDFTPVMQYSLYQYGLVVRPDSPWGTLKEFIAYAKANPGKIHFSTAGLGSYQHLVMERLALKEKIKWIHIPYDGGIAAITSLLGSHVEASAQTTEWKKHVEAGKLRLLAVFSEKRMQDFPDVPTLRELGYDVAAPSLLCIVGPKGLSPLVVETLHEAFKKAMGDPDFIKVSRQFDLPLVYRGPQELAQHIVAINEELGPLIQSLGLRKK